MTVPGPSRRRALLAGILAALVGGAAPGQALARLESGRPGPQVLVVGGVHGDEPSGALAAEALLAGPAPRAGRLVVIARANPEALDAGARAAPATGRDLNRAFPGAGTDPEARKAARIFTAALEADLVVDLHEEGGAWPEADLPTLVFSPAAAGRVLDLLDGLRARDPFAFTGGAPTGSLVGELGRLGRPALTVEVPARLPLEERVAMHRRVLEAVLRQAGLR